jgi:hypothetical protein
MNRTTFTEPTFAAESMGMSRTGLLQTAREGKLVAWVKPDERSNYDGDKLPFIVRAGRLQATSDGTGRKVAMPNGQFLVFEHDALVNLKGSGWLDLSLLIVQNRELLQAVRLLQDGETVELMPGVVLGDGAGNFYEVAPEGPRTLAEVGFMTKDIEALRAAHDAEPAPADESIADRDKRNDLDAVIEKPLPEWLLVTGDYIVTVMKAEQANTVKKLYRVLEAKAGPESPFDKGTGQSAGRLFVRQIAGTLSEGTLKNYMPELRKMATR